MSSRLPFPATGRTYHVKPNIPYVPRIVALRSFSENPLRGTRTPPPAHVRFVPDTPTSIAILLHRKSNGKGILKNVKAAVLSTHPTVSNGVNLTYPLRKRTKAKPPLSGLPRVSSGSAEGFEPSPSADRLVGLRLTPVPVKTLRFLLCPTYVGVFAPFRGGDYIAHILEIAKAAILSPLYMNGNSIESVPARPISQTA